MTTEEKFKQLTEEIEAIKARNKRVEADKAWETSVVKRIFTALSTYLLITIIFYIIGVERAYIQAVIPAIAYIVSTSSYSILKSWWLKRKKE